ncbi:MAG: N-acyl-D-glucosamine 2-epimerase [Ectothiorhodospiraceae bacterium]|nr:N-acyl-D-glucosamine 2-epimerase [Ectothiorhodospiraceae bacterium]
MKTSDGREYKVRLKGNSYAQMIRNLGEPYHDCTGQMRSMIEPDRHLYVYGIFYPEAGDATFEAQFLLFDGRRTGEFVFERQDWWINQIRQLGDFYLNAQFGDQPVDYRNYRTTISLTGERPRDHFRQETDTISRLVYGFASAFLLTGDDRYLEGAEKGTEYLRDHMRFYDLDENIIYWYHGIDVHGQREDKVFASEFGDDFNAIPAYEQIYALAGPIQTYRITGDPRILQDAEMTVDLFDKYYLDKEKGGYFSHLDPITLDPRSDALGENKGKKNWNSVGDHAPAYLINLYLATEDERYAKFLEYTFDTIAKYFPDYDESPFVQEKFFEDWSHDRTHMWQQNRGVVGHNLKIAWNLMRMYGLETKPEYEELARKIAEVMPMIGGDRQRHGWYDVMERAKQDGEDWYRYAFHDRKAWWQQEQGILAYLILCGVLGDDEYRRIARESSSFYNAFFLDHDDGAVFFNVLANGIPYLMGTERFKGSHSMSGYHSFELCYLAQIYTNLLITKRPLDLWFKPHPGGFSNGKLYVSPDILPKGAIKITEVWMDEDPYTAFDADGLTVDIPDDGKHHKFQVRVAPVDAK